MPKHVLMLLSNPFRPDPRVQREALSLIRAGYRVTILCWDRDQKHPASETQDGIGIIRLGPAAGWGESRGFIKALPKFWTNLRKSAADIDYDIVHAHDLDTLAPGLKLARKRKVPIIYDSHELYHEMAGENLSGFLLRALARYERKMVRKPPIMITVNEPLADIFRSYGARDVRVIMNCQPDHKPDAAKVERAGLEITPDGKPVALYIGVLEPNRLLLELAREHSSGKGDFILAMGGFGTLESELKAIAEKSNGRVRFLGRIAPSDVPAYNRAAGILLAAYDPALRNNSIGAPNKLFEAMAAGVPVIVSGGTYAAKVVEETGCGLSAGYSAAEVLGAAAGLLNDAEARARCGKLGRHAYESEYNWGLMEKRLLGIYADSFKKTD